MRKVAAFAITTFWQARTGLSLQNCPGIISLEASGEQIERLSNICNERGQMLVIKVPATCPVRNNPGSQSPLQTLCVVNRKTPNEDS
jgi:hypothetical protein